MKTKTLFLSFIMTLLNFSAFAVMSNDTIASSPKSGSGIINTEYISNAKALSIARQWYGNRTDVDYYFGGSVLIDNEYESSASALPDSSSWVRTGNHWLIVVDEHPGQNWSHNCGYIYVQSEKQKNTVTRSCKIVGKMLPQGVNLQLMNTRNLYGSNANIKPEVPQSQSGYNQNIAGRTYALILNCASSKHDNLERYWNDCSYIYKVLTRKYNVMCDNIRILMATDSLMRKADGSGYSTLPHNIGTDIMRLDVNTIHNCLDELKCNMTTNDHLLVFITGNGGTSSTGEPYIMLQGGERMTADELDLMLRNVNVRTIDYVLGLSNAEPFINYLSGKGRVVTVATSANGVASSCSNKPFSEFVMNWTAAMAGCDISGNEVNADTDNNGKATLAEAFIYAKNHTNNCDGEISTENRYLMEDIAFNNIPEAVDLYMRDNTEDTGKEPSIGKYYKSPDIWFRNHPDGTTKQYDEAIRFEEESGLVYLYSRVWNRGKDNYNNSNRHMHYYYAFSPIATARTFLGGNRDVSPELEGGELSSTKTISGIVKADSCVILQKQVFIDEDMALHKNRFNILNLNTLLVISNIKSTGVNLLDSIQQGFVAVQARNDIAQFNKRFYFTNGREATITIHISDSIMSQYTFVGIDRNDLAVSIEMSDHAFQLWRAHGSNAHNVTSSPSNPKLFHFNSNDSYLCYYNDLPDDSIKFTVSYVPEALTEPTEFEISMEKRDYSTNELLTGAEFVIVFGQQTSSMSLAPQIDCTLENGKYTLAESSISEDATYDWRDNQGNTIGNTQSIVIDADKARGTYSLTVNSKNNDAQGCATIELDNIPIIKSITPNPFDNELNIQLSRKASCGTEIIISGITVPNVQSSISIPEGESSIKLFASDYPAGTYAISVVENGKTIGYKKVIKK